MLDEMPAPRRLVVQWVPHGYGQRAMNLPFCFWLWRRSVTGDSIEVIVHEPFVTFSGGIRQRALAVVQRAMTLMLMRAARRVWVTTRAWTPLLEPYLSGRGIAVEWLPVPSSLQEPDAVAVEEIRRRYSPGKECLIGSFGTHGPLVTSLLGDAIRLLAGEHPTARVMLIGSGSEVFRSALVGDDRSLDHRVTATGSLNADELSAHIAACDVLLQPYPDGVTCRRTTAMAGLFARVPVVTTRGALTERIWQHDTPVKLADVGDVRGIVQHVLHLIADPAERRRQADAGRAFYDRWFDVRHTVAAIAG
jgi:glycosyltransferase involved in cell wall biosynthesis